MDNHGHLWMAVDNFFGSAVRIMELDQLRNALLEIINTPYPAVPWRDGQQLPWNDQRFSARVLPVHLDQTTHMASRTTAVIGQHVDWLLELAATELPSPPSAGGLLHPRVLDVGCGPGLYCHELCRRGCRTTGFDFSPAAISYARKTATRYGLDCRFLEFDLTDLPVDFVSQNGPFELITFWFGEFNSFQPETAARFLSRLTECLTPGGLFVLEFQPYDLFPQENTKDWEVLENSVFSDHPHVWLKEFSWNEELQTEINVHWIIDSASGRVNRFAQCHQAYQDDELLALLADAGLENPTFYPPIAGVSDVFEFPVLVTRKKVK